MADYPFTTLSPVLGTIEGEDRQAVVADIPGLIEGAAEGAGLGHEFLAHVERCSMLVHLVDMAPLEGEPEANYETVRAELAAHGAGLERLPELVVLTKRDLLDAEEVEATAGRVVASGLATGPRRDGGLLGDRRGPRRAAARILAELPEAPPAPRRAGRAGGEFEAEHRVYRPAGEGGYWVEREEDGGFRVLGRGVELLFERHDTKNEEALAYLEQRLREIGVIAALSQAGFEPGDDVRIGEHEFELHSRLGDVRRAPRRAKPRTVRRPGSGGPARASDSSSRSASPAAPGGEAVDRGRVAADASAEVAASSPAQIAATQPQPQDRCARLPGSSIGSAEPSASGRLETKIATSSATPISPLAARPIPRTGCSGMPSRKAPAPARCRRRVPARPRRPRPAECAWRSARRARSR